MLFIDFSNQIIFEAEMFAGSKTRNQKEVDTVCVGRGYILTKPFFFFFFNLDPIYNNTRPSEKERFFGLLSDNNFFSGVARERCMDVFSNSTRFLGFVTILCVTLSTIYTSITENEIF